MLLPKIFEPELYTVEEVTVCTTKVVAVIGPFTVNEPLIPADPVNGKGDIYPVK
jgi:hypothetical protein